MNEVVSFKTGVTISAMNVRLYLVLFSGVFFNKHLFRCKTHLFIQYFGISTLGMSVVNFKQRSDCITPLFTNCNGSTLPRKKKSNFWSFSIQS